MGVRPHRPASSVARGMAVECEGESKNKTKQSPVCHNRRAPPPSIHSAQHARTMPPRRRPSPAQGEADAPPPRPPPPNRAPPPPATDGAFADPDADDSANEVATARPSYTAPPTPVALDAAFLGTGLAAVALLFAARAPEAYMVSEHAHSP